MCTSHSVSFRSFRFGRFVSVVSSRSFRFSGFVSFVSVVSIVSFRWFLFGVSGFSTCEKFNPARSDGGPCALNQSAVYMALFSKHFDAHDALEDVKALRRILFESRLNLSTTDLLNYCQPITFNEAYDNSDGKSTISKCMLEKIAGRGLCYTNLKHILDKFGRKGVARALCTSPPGFKKPRVTKTKRILLAIVRHFEHSHEQ